MENNMFTAWKGEDKRNLLFSIEDKYLNQLVKIVKTDHVLELLPATVYSFQSKWMSFIIFNAENIYFQYLFLLVGMLK